MPSLATKPPITFRSSKFAQYTLDQRLPSLLQDIIDSKSFDGQINNRISAFKNQLPKHQVTHLKLFPDEEPYWDSFYSRHEGKAFVDLPFFDAEIYFYRYLLELTNFTENPIDPFAFKKQAELEGQLLVLEEMAASSKQTTLEEAIMLALTGNQADLSLLHRQSETLELIIDHKEQLFHSFSASRTIHLILDNAGRELVGDLIFAYHVLKNQQASQVIIYPKMLPLFVSDSTEEDIKLTLDFMGHSGVGELVGLAEDMQKRLANQQLIIHTLPIWNTPNHFTQLQEVLRQYFDQENLVIAKGDANYRRFFEDRHVPTDWEGGAELSNHQFALRTLKSEIITGLSIQKAATLYSQDSSWMTRGRCAVIQQL